MIKTKITSLIFLILTNSVVAQHKLLSDSIKLTNSIKLIATSSEYKEYEFSIEKKQDIISEAKKLNYSNETETESEDEKKPVVIKLISSGKILRMWIVNPSSSTIIIDKKKYFFDIKQLANLHKKYPINYVVEEKIFSTESELNLYYSKLLTDTSFLYIVSPDFELQWQGQFNVTFKKEGLFSSPTNVMNYIKPLMIKIVPRDKFSLSYQPFTKVNQVSPDEITINVKSNYKLFEEFTDKNARKGDWIANPYTAYIIRKK